MASLRYRLVGSGPNRVIAAHTWLADHQTYAPMIPFLDTATLTVAFPDFRGYGLSRDIAGEFTIREMGRDLLGVADELGWEQFHLVGNSMGGQAVQWLAGQPMAAERVQSVLLLCSVPAGGAPLDEGTASFFDSAIDDVTVRGQLGSAVTGGRLGDGFAAFMVRLSAETATREAIKGYLRAWTREDVSAEIAPYRGPVQVCVGQHDPVLTEEVARTGILPLFPTATLATLEGSGHYPPMEIPAHSAALIGRLCKAGVAS
ncbi:alpha/beta fold hydrolase [Azospirillum canadense]|uniref:alpha/beta fold hydrolase n=1 Tax=Azospirillum canadense TaxID=403962 RepID=UPI002225F07C|nr:alpha/beta hydrolase [Azospirillum canadense]MCW2239732.1 pimeloyl-ACP methyl ester carboxylesterase [Azospirillum canadense]